MAKLDQSLILSADQRTKLTDSLLSHWNELWALGFQNYHFENEYMPMIPDSLISPFLNDDQKKVWVGFQKVSLNAGGIAGINTVVGMNMFDAPLDDEFPDEVAKEDPKPESKK